FAWDYIALFEHPLPRLTLFPYTTLFRSRLFRRLRPHLLEQRHRLGELRIRAAPALFFDRFLPLPLPLRKRQLALRQLVRLFFELDRKSTRLNSSHVKISYAVFCFKKRKS